MSDDAEIAAWWNKFKDSGLWSSAIVNLAWDKLRPEAREELGIVFTYALLARDDYHNETD